MPRIYVKKNALQQYSTEAMEKAYTMVTIDGAPFSTAARACGVPCTTLRRYVVKEKTEDSVGRRRVLSDEEEDLLVVALEYTAKAGFS